ncbi:hypothetical protein [Myxococcus sp. CA039A]|uniref:hypothetical protein n=1 Tax=Myxococcus sp. CA039A TaxID=2741737 RepID=UPI00157A4BED|nr:hypothetical protein [Myxococcus sp. CA039A]NTX52376.1 hypothetical protein [Myxococcus sp. CA039A]
MSAGGKPSAGQGAESAKKPARKPEPAVAPKAQGKSPGAAQAPRAQAKQAGGAQATRAQAKPTGDAQAPRAQAKAAGDAQAPKAQGKSAGDTQASKAQAKAAGDVQAPRAQAKSAGDAQATKSQGNSAAGDTQASKAQVKPAGDAQALKGQSKATGTSESAKPQAKPVGKGQAKSADVTPQEISLKSVEGVKSQATPIETAHEAKPRATPIETAHEAKPRATPIETAQEKKPQATSIETAQETNPQATPIEEAHEAKPHVKVVEAPHASKPRANSVASPPSEAPAKPPSRRGLTLVSSRGASVESEESSSDDVIIAEVPPIEDEAPPPRYEARTHTRPPLSVGDLDSEVLPISALAPIEGTFTGAPLLVHSSPETIRTWGVLGSTMSRLVPGKSEGGYTFSGQARLFVRAINRVEAASEGTGRCSVVLRNTSGRPIQLQVKGGLFSKYLTPQFPPSTTGAPFNPLSQERIDEDLTGLVDAQAEQGKEPDPEGLFFRGPHAVLASGLLDAVLDARDESERQSRPLVRDDLDLSHLDDVRLGTRGAFEGSLTVPPGATVVVLDARHEKSGTLCALLDFTALDSKGQVDPGARFRLATVSSPLPLTPDELAAISRSEHPLATAGDAGTTAFPSLQGVSEAGSLFVGERTLRLSPGTLAGDLVMSMPRRRAGTGPDAPTLTPTSGTSASRAASARDDRTHDGARGVSYQLTYTLENEDSEPREVELLLTSPRLHPSEHFFPQAGVLNLAMKVDGQRVDVRVNQRGEGRVLAVLELPPEGRRQVRLEWTHVGGTFPPAGLELRARR